MKNFLISRLPFTHMFWRIMFSNGASIADQAKNCILSKHAQIEALRKTSTYDTGSISVSASVSIALVTNYFRPDVIAEVGTFIGRSTYSLALGCTLNGLAPPQIHTCDYSNDIRVDIDPVMEGVTQYPKTSSTDMLTALVEKNISPDMFLLDGRLQENDISLLAKLRAEHSVFILDDFEGTEKGVANVMMLTNAFKDKFLLAYPASDSFLSAHGLTDSSTAAVLVPTSRVGFVNQG